MARIGWEFRGERFHVDPEEVTGKEWDQVKRVTGHGGLSFFEPFTDGSIKDDEHAGAMVNALAWLASRQASRDPGSIDDVDVPMLPFLVEFMYALAAALGVKVERRDAEEGGEPPLGRSSTSGGRSSVPGKKQSGRRRSTLAPATTSAPETTSAV